MKLLIDKSFEKDTDKIHNKKLIRQVAACIEQVISAANSTEIRNLKKLQGFKNHYRIRIGEYRVGLRIENHVAIFERFLNRKDIYKYYPG